MKENKGRCDDPLLRERKHQLLWAATRDFNSMRTSAVNEDWQLVTSPEYVLFHPCNITDHHYYFIIKYVFLKGIFFSAVIIQYSKLLIQYPPDISVFKRKTCNIRIHKKTFLGLTKVSGSHLNEGLVRHNTCEK